MVKKYWLFVFCVFATLSTSLQALADQRNSRNFSGISVGMRLEILRRLAWGGHYNPTLMFQIEETEFPNIRRVTARSAFIRDFHVSFMEPNLITLRVDNLLDKDHEERAQLFSDILESLLNASREELRSAPGVFVANILNNLRESAYDPSDLERLIRAIPPSRFGREFFRERSPVILRFYLERLSFLSHEERANFALFDENLPATAPDSSDLFISDMRLAGLEHRLGLWLATSHGLFQGGVASFLPLFDRETRSLILPAPEQVLALAQSLTRFFDANNGPLMFLDADLSEAIQYNNHSSPEFTEFADSLRPVLVELQLLREAVRSLSQLPAGADPTQALRSLDTRMTAFRNTIEESPAFISELRGCEYIVLP